MLLLLLLLWAGGSRAMPSSPIKANQHEPPTSYCATVLLVGSGRMGQIRASILHANPRFQLAGIVDVKEELGQALADQYATKSYPDLESALADHPSCAGIVISTPTSTHRSLIQTAARHNIHVFCEKPIDETAELMYELTASCHNICICCGFQRRFDTSYVACQQAIATGRIGTPVAAHVVFADHPPIPKHFLLQGGADIFLDLCAHDVDYLMHAMDDHVVSVYATATSSTMEYQQAGVHDNAVMVLTFSRGAVATIFLSRSATYGYDQRCEIFGDEGLVSVLNQPETSTVLSNRDGIHHSKWKHSFPQRFQEAFAREMDAFADTLLLGTKWPISTRQCQRVQRVADAARLSAQQGRAIAVVCEGDDDDQASG